MGGGKMTEETLLSDVHRDFICQKLALFVPHREIASEMLEQYPELQVSEDELITRIKYYSANKKAAKWQERIAIYRGIFNYNLRENFSIANRFTRVRKLEKIMSEALKPRLSRVITYQDGEDKKIG